MGKSTDGKLLLTLQGNEVVVPRPPPLPFPDGQRLELELLSKTPLPTFRLRPFVPTAADPASVQQALRTALPRQQPLPPLLANLTILATEPQSAPPMPKEVAQLSQQLYQQLPTPKQLQQVMALKNALQQTGPFLESDLAKAVAGHPLNTERNLRLTLLRLAASLRHHLPAERPQLPPSSPGVTLATPDLSPSGRSTQPAPPYAQTPAGSPQQAADNSTIRQTPQPQSQSKASLLTVSTQENGLEELLRQVEGVLNRGQVHQLQNLHAENQGRPLWAMELPIRTEQGIDLFDLRIERDAEHQRGDSESIPWSVTLAFDLDGLGPIRAAVSLRGDQITTRFWAERETTSTLFNQYLDTLRSRLHHAGLNVGRLECRCGMPVETNTDLEPQLLDEKA